MKHSQEFASVAEAVAQRSQVPLANLPHVLTPLFACNITTFLLHYQVLPAIIAIVKNTMERANETHSCSKKQAVE